MEQTVIISTLENLREKANRLDLQSEGAITELNTICSASLILLKQLPITPKQGKAIKLPKTLFENCLAEMEGNFQKHTGSYHVDPYKRICLNANIKLGLKASLFIANEIFRNNPHQRPLSSLIAFPNAAPHYFSFKQL